MIGDWLSKPERFKSKTTAVLQFMLEAPVAQSFVYRSQIVTEWMNECDVFIGQ